MMRPTGRFCSSAGAVHSQAMTLPVLTKRRQGRRLERLIDAWSHHAWPANPSFTDQRNVRGELSAKVTQVGRWLALHTRFA